MEGLMKSAFAFFRNISLLNIITVLLLITQLPGAYDRISFSTVKQAAEGSGSITHTTYGDFSQSCAVKSNSHVYDSGDGAVGLSASFVENFDNPPLNPAKWAALSYTGGSYTVDITAGILTMDAGGHVQSLATQTHGFIEAKALFGPGAWQHIGFQDATLQKYIIFGTGPSITHLFARINDGTNPEQTVDLGLIPTAMHRFSIEWSAKDASNDQVIFRVDGVSVSPDPLVVSNVGMTNFYTDLANNGDNNLQIDSIQTTPTYMSSGSYTSCSADAGTGNIWTTIGWNGAFPSGSGLAVDVRTSTDASDWSDWSTVNTAAGSSVPAPRQYVQYRLSLTTSDSQVSALVNDVTLTYGSKLTPVLSITNSPVSYSGSPQTALFSSTANGTVKNVKYNGSSTAPTVVGTYPVTADFTSDDPAYTDLTGASAGDFVINPVAPTLSVTNSPVTYNGSAQAAVIGHSSAGTVSNVKYDGSSTVPSDAGNYPVTADFTSTNTNYTNLTGAAVGNFVIDPATPTLAVNNSPVTYSGSAQAATISHSVAGTVSNINYDGSATVPTNAHTYAVTADFASTDGNYKSLTAASAGNFVINPATPTLSVTNSPVTYNGSAQAAVVSHPGAGTINNVKYNGSATVPTNANTYTITADFTCTDGNYTNLTAASAGSFVINPATPTLSVTNSPVIYNGSPQAAVIGYPGTGTVSLVKYDGSTTVPTGPGTYAVTANFDSTNDNYSDVTGASAGNFVINPANPSLKLERSVTPGTYGSVGTGIQFSFVVTNIGDVTLLGPISITDSQLTVSCPSTGSLAPLASVTCTASHTITTTDITNGKFSTSATATASFDGNTISSNTVVVGVYTNRILFPLVRK
jgi:hypothetical protein